MKKDDILELISSANKKGMNIETISNKLQMKETDDFKDLIKLLNQLEEDLIIAHDENDHFHMSGRLGYFKGTLKINPKGYGFVENTEESVYVHADHIHYAMNNDIVYAKSWDNADGTRECDIVRIIEHNVETIVGVIKIKEGETYFLPDTYLPQRIKITNLQDYKLVNDQKVIIRIDTYGKLLKCHIEKILGHKYDPGMDILSIIYEHGIDPEFPEDVLQEAQHVEESITDKDLKERTDLRHLPLITIDGDDAKDLDDAISVEKIDEGYRLGVHIADVSHYVKPGTALDKEAYERGTSVYVVDRVVPMLPHVLCNGICSLNPRVDRLTLTCMMDIDMQGEIITYQIFPSIIKTVERMTYTNVNLILDGNKKVQQKYEHILGLCRHMEALSKIIRKRRVGLGAIDFDTKEAQILVDKKGKPTDIVLRERGESERIIEDFMICANECVATHTRWLELPSVYRIHESPEPKKMREFVRIAKTLGYKFHGSIQSVFPKQLQELLEEARGEENYQVLSTYMLRSMQKAKYDRRPIGHFGLGLENYTHFTSPIRRYPDLIVHRYLRKYCFQNQYDAMGITSDEQWIENAATHASAKERNAIECERDVDDMKKSEYMEKYIGCEYDGVISGITKFGMFVELENTVEGLVHISNLKDDYYQYDDMSKSLIGERTAQVYKMGQRVYVQVLNADHYKKQIDFIVINKKQKKGNITRGKTNERKSVRVESSSTKRVHRKSSSGRSAKQTNRGSTRR